MTAKKPILETDHINRRMFSYKVGNVNLSFTLRTDVKIEIKAFLEILDRATVEVKEELAKVGKKGND